MPAVSIIFSHAMLVGIGVDEFNKNVIKWDYTKAFPVSLGEINYNYRTGDEIESTFEFAFHEVVVTLL